MTDDTGQVTRVLRRLAAGDGTAESELFELLASELRRMAAGQLKNERNAHTLSPTALVNEMYLRLASHWQYNWQGKVHFMAVAAKAMRRVLVDYARANATAKRRGILVDAELDQFAGTSVRLDERLLAVDEAVTRLAAQDARKALVVELRYFAGQTESETAAILNVTRRTVNRDWEFARAWLTNELRGAINDGS